MQNRSHLVLSVAHSICRFPAGIVTAFAVFLVFFATSGQPKIAVWA